MYPLKLIVFQPFGRRTWLARAKIVDNFWEILSCVENWINSI